MDRFDGIRKAIRNILREDFRFQYDNKLFYPNDEMVSACRKALDCVTKNKLTGKGEAEGTGIRKANSIISKKGMTHGQVKRMKAFFDNNLDRYKQEKMAGRSINDSGLIQKWNLWGGDSAMSWANTAIGSHKSQNQKSKDNRPKGHKRMMDPTNTRTRTAYSYVKNSLHEGSEDENKQDLNSNGFEGIVKKWAAYKRPTADGAFKYWFPLEAEDDLKRLGFGPNNYKTEIATDQPWKGQKFIVLLRVPKSQD